MGTKLKLIDYNIRCCDDGENRLVTDRAPRLEALIRKYDPDLIGLQEASWRWMEHLEDSFLDRYRMRYLYRNEKSRESTPILWKKDKFDLIDEGYFWLSDMPEMSTKSFGTTYHRICNYVRLKVKETEEQFIFINTHMGGGVSSCKSAELIMKRMEARGAFKEYPALLTGDFNILPTSNAYEILNNSGKFRDLNDALGFDVSTTVHGYLPEKVEDNYIIDYVFFTPNGMEPCSYQVLNEQFLGGCISDHRGLMVEIELKEMTKDGE